MARHSTLIRIAAVAAMILSSRAQAQPPNDECENAIPLSPCGSLNTSNIGATGAGNVACVPFAWYDVWYSVAVPGPGMLRVYTCPSALDTVLSIHTGCPGSPSNMIACNNDSPYCGTAYPGASHLTVQAGGPTTYYIRVAGASNSTGLFTLNTEFTPPNNDCLSGILIGDGATIGHTICATIDGSADCAPLAPGPDVWYRYVPICTGTLLVYTCPASFDTVISVHTGCPGTAGNQIACNDDSLYCGTAYPNASALTVPVTGGQIYRIRVSGFNGAIGTFILNTSLTVPAPTNDDCANAVSVGDGDTPFYTCSATTDGPAEPLCQFNGSPQIGSDVWYRYTAPCTGHATVSLCGSNFNTKLGVYHAACPTMPGQVIACDDDTCGDDSSLFFLTTAGQQYLIRVGGFGSAQGSGTMSISCTPDPCYPDCNGDGSLTVADFGCFQTTFVAADPYTDCNGDGARTVADFGCFQTRFVAGCP